LACLHRISTRFFACAFALAVALFLAATMSAQQAAPAVPAAAPQPQSAPVIAGDDAVRQVLDRYCVTCHNDRLKTFGLSLDKTAVDSSNPTAHAEIWEKVIRKIRTGAMPPARAPRPDKASLSQVAASLEDRLDRAAAANPDPGRTPVFHRLNRTEYQNAIRDLLSADIDVSELLPPDQPSEVGFDNIASLLTLSPVLLEQYLSTARKISELTLGGESVATDVRIYEIPADYKQETRRSDMPFGTRGGTAIQHYFPVSGEYSIKVGLAGNDVSQMDVRIDGQRVGLVAVRAAAVARPNPNDPAVVESAPQAADPELTLPVKAGAHSVAITFQGDPPTAIEGLTRRGGGGGGRGGGGGGGRGGAAPVMRSVSSVTITGPLKAVSMDDSPAFKRIMVCVPKSASEEAKCARDIVASLMRRAYRRPVTDREVDLLMPFYAEGRSAGGFSAGVRLAMQRVLVSPAFLFRIEQAPAAAAAAAGRAATRRLTDIELASRLSFFLWSSIPDDSLLDAAAAGRLKDPKVFSDQVARMLADPKSEALVRNFAGQWLHLRELEHQKPDPRAYPDVDKNLLEALGRQTELLFDSVLREKRSVYELLTADYMFINERLARHYGIPNIYGDHFRRIPLSSKDDVRGGLLGQGSILMVTSYANRTSPVKRGKFVLDLVGSPPPPPPPNVPALKTDAAGGKALSMRESMVQHRANPVCATCHSRMDPIGFALEGFDAVGRSRTTGEDGAPIDTSGELPDRTAFNGPAQLRDALLLSKEQFRNAVIEKLLTYAVGREVTYLDGPVVRDIARKAAAGNDSLHQLIVGVTQSVPFQMRRSD
jgi:mono/diheme cytochrome c family protein